MIKFFSRLIIFVIAISIIFGFSPELQITPFMIGGIFMCAWITVIPLRDIFWWLVTFAVIFSFVYYDNLGIYIISLIGVSYLFDFIYIQLKRLSNDNAFTLYLTSFSIVFVIGTLIELIQFHTVFINFKLMFINIIMTIILFFIFKFIIERIEKFINLYTHGTDMRCHT